MARATYTSHSPFFPASEALLNVCLALHRCIKSQRSQLFLLCLIPLGILDLVLIWISEGSMDCSPENDSDHKFVASVQTNWVLYGNSFWQPSGIVYFEWKDWTFISCSLNHAFPFTLAFQFHAHYPPTAFWCCAICFSSHHALCHGNLPISSYEYS